jgi:hypothetical protein
MAFGRTRVPKVMGCPLSSDSPAVTVNINIDPDFPGETEENHEKASQDGWCRGQDSKRALLYICVPVE